MRPVFNQPDYAQKNLMMAAAMGFLIAGGWKIHRQVNHLSARIEALESGRGIVEEGRSMAGFPVVDPRIARLEERVRTLEDVLEKKIVRQGVDTDPKKIRDIPAGF